MTIIKIIILMAVLLSTMLFFTLVRNGANLFEEPGVSKRIGVFLTLNSASTSDNPYFEELRTPVFDMPAEELYKHTLNTVNVLGWGIIAHDSDKYNMNFIVRSPVFLFEDDVFVQINFINENQSSLYIQSGSRSGRADFAANSGHIQALIKGLRK